ncbi:hypothetical protein QEZ54_12950 [Catellatospora sp. KI3]|uniref:hypothetical protein n=1 Tax=Catellatospora sp. KI3 TaxID=3041620 RepID=UPI0024829F49|nr:hypothetical protein [Catellatospora sp. KI3]MDI1461880.1 hypothetical protein [Catellatospora sp. KI3]
MLIPSAASALTGSEATVVSAVPAQSQPAASPDPVPAAPSTPATPSTPASASPATKAPEVRAQRPVSNTKESRSLVPGPVTVDFKGDYLGWAMLDRHTGEVVAAENAHQTSSTESMIKIWLVSDYLRRAADSGQTVTQDWLTKASDAIRHSDDRAAQALYVANGSDESVHRMIQMCGMTDTSAYKSWWSRTQMSPRDALRLASCVADGTAAGAEWTGWVLSEMQRVEGSTARADQQATRGGGRWGIIDGVPSTLARTLAIKNGWTAIGADSSWHLNCLAISDDWIMSVMTRYPVANGLQYGADVCASVAGQLLPRA